jgi:hypothetical protein
MRLDQIVVLLPAQQLLPHILEGDEHLDIQTLIPSTPIETLVDAMFEGCPWPNTVQLNAVAAGPRVHDPTGELAANVQAVIARGAPRCMKTGCNACATVFPLRD